MAETQGQEPTTPAADTPAPGITTVTTQEAEPTVFDATYVKQLRSEAAKYRKSLSDLEAKFKADEDAKLSEQERLTKKVAELEPLTESVREYEAAMSEMLEARLRGMTPEAKKAVESLPATDPLSRLRWLTANEGLFTRQAAPKLDGGAGGGERKQGITLNAEQEAMAKKMGIAPDKYAARLAEMKAAKEK